MSNMSEIQRRLEQASGKAARAPAPEAPPAAPEPTTAKRPVAPSREGKVHVGAYLPPDYLRNLRMLKATTDKPIEQLLARALNDLFRANNLPVIDSD
jgi:hypothetical protein